MKLLPFSGFIVAGYFFYLQQKRKLSDRIYRLIYTLAGVHAIIWGVTGICNSLFKRDIYDHGFYPYFVAFRGLVAGLFLAYCVLVIAIEKHEKKKQSKG